MINDTGMISNDMTIPYSQEAEQGVLASILIKPENLAEVMDILPSGDYFYLSIHQAIYQAMVDLFTYSRPADLVTILERLKGNSNFSENELKVYLVQIADMVPSISAVEEYARIVREKYVVRKLIAAAKEILEETAHYTEGNAGKLIDTAEQKIFDIRDNKSIKGLEKLDNIVLETFDRLDLLNSPESELYKGIPTGIGPLDSTITGLNRSDLIILAARPGMGKTSFALNIARHVSVKCKRKVAFFSLEMSKEQLASRLLSTEGLIPSIKLRTGKLSGDEWSRLIEAGDILSKAEMYVDDTSDITVPEMKAKLRRLKNVDLVIIDYLQLMKPSRAINNRVQEVSEITRNLKILAKEFHVPVIMLSQLSRASEQRAEHKPQLSDLRDSGSIEQDADIVLFLYREDYYKEKDNEAPSETANSGECIVAKNRHGETRSVPLHWQGEFMRFTSEVVNGE